MSTARHSLAPRRRSGTLLSQSIDRDGTLHRDTAQCAHCGHTWVYTPKSGKVRGFCTRCMGFVCGPLCPAGDQCLHREQLLANIERGLPLDTPAPQAVSLAGCYVPGE